MRNACFWFLRNLRNGLFNESVRKSRRIFNPSSFIPRGEVLRHSLPLLAARFQINNTSTEWRHDLVDAQELENWVNLLKQILRLKYEADRSTPVATLRSQCKINSCKPFKQCSDYFPILFIINPYVKAIEALHLGLGNPVVDRVGGCASHPVHTQTHIPSTHTHPVHTHKPSAAHSLCSYTKWVSMMLCRPTKKQILT